jgi:hypothetical protein
LKFLELNAIVNTLQALVYGPLSPRSGVLLEERRNIRTLFFGTKVPEG